MKTKEYSVDLAVIGGGMSGVCAAISAARHGVKVLLMQDRPMFGGNASSEIRMWIGGAKGKGDRESGLIEEIECENYYYNTNLTFSMWDTVVYQKVLAEKNITFLLNTSAMEAGMKEGRIAFVKGWQSNAETFHIVKAKYFADCSGDGIIAGLTGAATMMGREAKSEFGESIPPDVKDKKTMGMSCLFQIRETDSPKKFIKPPFAYTYKDNDEFVFKGHEKLRDQNYWWIEYGGTKDCLHDTDEIREELLKIAYGVWDHVKNQGDHGADNWVMDWIGFLPGKRESRRYIGKYIVTENDVNEAGKHFDDVIAYGGWSMDDHFPEGFYWKKSHPTIYHKAPSPWCLPYRALIHRDISNLLFAGRNISVTHAALSSSRVMATCSLLGQALGTSIAECLKENKDPEFINVKEVQKMLLDDDCYLPGLKREVNPINLRSPITPEVLHNGIERGEDNVYVSEIGEPISYEFASPVVISGVRLVFDSHLERDFDNMPCTYNLNETRYRTAETMVKDFNLEFVLDNGEKKIVEIKDNFLRFVKVPFAGNVKKVSLVPLSTYGNEKARIFNFELM